MMKIVTSTIDERGVAWLMINRPEKRNAFDDILITELTDVITSLNENSTVRIVVLSGAGKVFSSGADLGWMKSMAAYSEQDNLDDSLKLAELMYQLYYLKKPTIAKVNGDAYGGAIGLIACCDISIGFNDAQFSFSEVKLGIVPAVISPYIVAAMGARQAKRLFLTGEKFSAADACRMGLLYDCVSHNELDKAVEKNISYLLSGGAAAQEEIKKLVHEFSPIDKNTKQRTAELIARVRITPEGQEGLSAFLEKRAPAWRTKD